MYTNLKHEARAPIIVGNWKMNAQLCDLPHLKTIKEGLVSHGRSQRIGLCLPSSLLYAANLCLGGSDEVLFLGAQDCHWKDCGAYTGDISAAMLKDVGARYVLIGHSERRSGHAQETPFLSQKIEAAWRHDLTVILCVGESLEEKEQGHTLAVLAQQLEASLPQDRKLSKIIIAYEPIWAIGTGKVPLGEEIALVHNFLRNDLVKRLGIQAAWVPLLYGGSVNASNAEKILTIENVDGVLVGGASLKPKDFLEICRISSIGMGK